VERNFAKELFSRQGAVFVSHAQIAGKDGSMYTLAFSENGATATAKSGFSGVRDNTQLNKDGGKNDVQIRNGVWNGVSGFLQALGVEEETADTVADVLFRFMMTGKKP
jgi:hypothetical protein